MIKLTYGQANFNEAIAALFNRAAFPPEAEKSAAAIIADVRARGNEAVSEYAEKFDRTKLSAKDFKVTIEQIEEAANVLPKEDKAAIEMAFNNISDFAVATLPKNWTSSPREGVVIGEKYTPMDRVGVYIPGGTAPLVSTVIHTAGIAKAAGVKEIVAITPPGNIPPATLYAMKVAGVTEVYRLGGVYGVAALALGTQTIKKVEKIVGPGNAYVTAAKKLLYGEVAIDLVAGPSEILVIADETANAEFVAADLISQAEHGSGFEQAVLICNCKEKIAEIEAAVIRQRNTRKRQETIDKVLEKGVFLIEVPDLETACVLASNYAPEHLEIQTKEPEKYAQMITAAGAIFLGSWTPESLGDFCAGPSHVLPTASSAKSFNGLETRSFMRRTSIVQYTKEAMMKEVETIERFGNMEQLDGHGFAGTVRRNG